jgi:hypothetical protein
MSADVTQQPTYSVAPLFNALPRFPFPIDHNRPYTPTRWLAPLAHWTIWSTSPLRASSPPPSPASSASASPSTRAARTQTASRATRSSHCRPGHISSSSPSCARPRSIRRGRPSAAHGRRTGGRTRRPAGPTGRSSAGRGARRRRSTMRPSPEDARVRMASASSGG